MSKNLIVDDFGCEERAFVHGIKTEAALNYIKNYVMRGVGMLCVTTNLESQDLMVRYESLLDCFRDVFVPLKLKGASARQWMTPETGVCPQEKWGLSPRKYRRNAFTSSDRVAPMTDAGGF